MISHKQVPAVDCQFFEQAFLAFHEAVSGTSSDRDEAAIVAVVAKLVPNFQTTGTGKDLFRAASTRLFALDDLLHLHKEQILKHQGFPGQWVAKAATASLNALGEFQSSDFPWPTETEVENLKGKDRKKPMLVWARIRGLVEASDSGPCTGFEVASKVCIDIHGSEKSARAAKAKWGGIVMQIDPASLRGQNEFDDEVNLRRQDDNDLDAGRAHDTAYISIACDAVEHKTVYQSFEDASISDEPPTGDVEYQKLMEFVGSGKKFLDDLEAATDWFVHQ